MYVLEIEGVAAKDKKLKDNRRRRPLSTRLAPGRYRNLAVTRGDAPSSLSFS
jgi:hypothetical protein